jgi:hypothetical protein
MEACLTVCAEEVCGLREKRERRRRKENDHLVFFYVSHLP